VNANEIFLGSDPSPFLEYTQNVIYLNEKQMAIIDSNGYKIKDFNGFNLDVEIETIPYGLESIQKQGFEHFMLKEIYEQPETILNCFRGKINHIENISIKDNKPTRIVLVACGTSYYAALVGKYLIEKTTNIPVIVEQASEFRYRQPMLFTSDLIIGLSQSGETADTLEAIRLCKKLNCNVAGIVNVTGSSIAKECGQGIYLHAGPEIGVASTKAFTSQIIALNLLNLFLNKNPYYRLEITDELKQLPNKVKEFLNTQKISEIAYAFKDSKYFLFLGRDINYPVALEGALKLKEISYNPSEGHPAGEMKHGPIALIDENTPVIVILTKDNVYEKVLSNMQEVKARKGKIICICDEINEEIQKLSSYIIQVPKTRWEFSPIMNVIPIQLFAYYIAKLNNREIDQPRNLAKAVSVE
jgi:glucosamine--fructose-6-phosphate aminotransferase (isomerizing)